MRALILVDIQNDFLPGGALPVPDGEKIIPVVNKLQRGFELVVATQDWHPGNHKSFASQHGGKKPFEVIELEGLRQTLWPDHCVQGTPGADFSKALEMNRPEAIFRKGTSPGIDSYSGFFDNGHRKNTGLADYLKGRGVKEVFLTGLAAEICVFFTAMDSLKEGFQTFLIEEATRPLHQKDFELAKKELVSKGGHIVNEKDC